LVQSPPRISKQPPTDEQLFQVVQAKINENDKPFLIECEAEGEPAPTYVFFIFSLFILHSISIRDT
ncbi:Neuroglian, partial [Ooceraea biroi]